jgi:hypothetical protein
MLDSILIEFTRGLMSYGTVIAPAEPTKTAFPASNWFLGGRIYRVQRRLLYGDRGFTYQEGCC